MKKIFLTLVFMIVSLCSLAQIDYISQAQTAVKKYYPQHIEYFNSIFAQINSISNVTKKIVNQKIKDNLDLFDEELPTDKDKVTTTLLVFEKLVDQKHFSESPDVGIEKEDVRFEIAREIVSDINTQIKKEVAYTRNESEKIRNESERIARRNEKIKEIVKSVNLDDKNKETAKIIIMKMDEYFCLYDDNELRKDIEEDASIQKIIIQYINLTKEYGITPSASGKRVIDAYKKYHK